MKTEQLVPAIEAVLFSGGEPVTIGQLSRALSAEPEEIEAAAEQLSERLNKSGAGIMLLRLENAYQLATRKEYEEYIKIAFDMRRRTPLSQAALEVLAVIAYNQPVTKAFVEQVRGVDCSGVVSTLVEKGLIEERGRLELPGRPLLYGTTKNFLRCFSVSSISELPPLPGKENGTAPELGEQLMVDELAEAEAAEAEE